MYHFRRSAISSVRSRLSGALKSKNKLVSILEYKPPAAECVSDVGLACFSSSAAEKSAVEHSVKRVSKLGFARQATAYSNQMTKDVLGANGIPVLYRWKCARGYMVSFRSPFQLMENHGANKIIPCSARSFASSASEKPRKTSSETRKDITTIEDPFDAPTYNIPEKPVSFAEGASYSVIILAGLAVAAAAAYAVFKELIFEPKEYKVFNKALKRVQDDAQVRVRIGSPITGYGSESRNRAARQRIINKIYTDEFGTERVEVNFYIRGPQGTGKVFVEMFKDQVDKQWKYTYLIVEINSPSRAQLMLESYMPEAAPTPA